MTPEVRRALDAAVRASQHALAGYRAGLLDEDEVRAELLRHGLVRGVDETWILDLRAGRWWRYDGVALGPDEVPLDHPGVARLRRVIDELAGDCVTSTRGDR